MMPDPLSYKLLLVGLLWLCFLLHILWPSERASACPRLPQPTPPPRKRSKDSKPFPGLTSQPHCAACEERAEPHREAPCVAPPRMIAL
jgi:hypothetical protein